MEHTHTHTKLGQIERSAADYCFCLLSFYPPNLYSDFMYFLAGILKKLIETQLCLSLSVSLSL